MSPLITCVFKALRKRKQKQGVEYACEYPLFHEMPKLADRNIVLENEFDQIEG